MMTFRVIVRKRRHNTFLAVVVLVLAGRKYEKTIKGKMATLRLALVGHHQYTLFYTIRKRTK